MKTEGHYPVIGLTGPMCAGKNAAAAYLARRGFAVADADRIAHGALEDMKDAVLAAFGSIAEAQGLSLIRHDGSIDRRVLASLVFGHPNRLSDLEGILYPRVDALLQAFIDEHIEQGIVINAPLLHKSAVLNRCAFVLFIDAWPLIRLIRAKLRDKLPFSAILERFSAQKHLYAQYKLKAVDTERVRNHGSIRVLERKLETLLLKRGY
jgi:dephospho-CoA kinase